MSRRSVVHAGALGAVAVVTVAYRYDPATAPFFPPCLFHVLTGLHCPGCGSLRAFHALLHGDVPRALSLNPLATAIMPFLFVGIVLEVRRFTSGSVPPGIRLPAWSIRALAMLIVVFGVLRNVPAFSWLAPR